MSRDNRFIALATPENINYRQDVKINVMQKL